MENKQTVTVIGAGLAGSEAAWQIAQAGYSVRLFEMKPQKFSPAHKSAGFAELICSNSLKAAHRQRRRAFERGNAPHGFSARCLCG